MDACPRCGEDKPVGEFYGPCQECRDQLNAKYFKEPVAREASSQPEYRSRVQVNAVALKEERDDEPTLGEGDAS